MTLKFPVVIFQALEPLQSQWPQQPHIIKTFTDPDGWIIPGTKMTNTVPFLLNESSKTQIFTEILYPFCQRLLRPADVTFLKNKESILKIYYLRILKLLSNKILLTLHYCQSQFIKSSSMWDTLYVMLEWKVQKLE